MSLHEFIPSDYQPIVPPDPKYPFSLYGCKKGIQTIFELNTPQVQIAYELALGIPRETILKIKDRKQSSTKTHISEIYEKLYITPGMQRMILPMFIMNGLIQAAENPAEIFPVSFDHYQSTLPDRHIQVDESKLVQEFNMPQDSSEVFTLAIIGTNLPDICQKTSQSEANVLKKLSQSCKHGITLENGLAICLMNDMARLVTSPVQRI